MGGCKCTYRNCTVKSDGRTHMFHYPVFDKMRCHQWLTYAQRLDFLDLKVSQLKNRVICQHHFTPDMFMNFKMDKLRFDAIPTENGPFCVASECPEPDLTIALEDIENDQLTCVDKKANLLVKYGDFLINSEMSTAELDKNTPKLKPVLCSKMLEVETKNALIDKKVTKSTDIHKPLLIKPRKKIRIISEKEISKPPIVHGTWKPVSPTLIINPRDRKKDLQMVPKIENTASNFENMEIIFCHQPPSGINQVDQQTDFNPLLIESQNIQNNQTTLVDPFNQHYETNFQVASHNIADPQNILNCPPITPIKRNDEYYKLDHRTTPEKNTQFNDKINTEKSSPKASVLKNMIPPERQAAIQEKRNFNKKLRDMIEYCLDELDDPDKQTNVNNIKYVVLPEESKSEKKTEQIKVITSEKQSNKEPRIGPRTRMKIQENIKNEKVSQKVISLLSKEPALPSKAEYGIASVEARLKKMEETLLRKIEQNAQRIVDLKNALVPTPAEKKSVTQPSDDEESHKKKLFQDISQYLSPEVNSLIYEEMFLNKFSKKSLLKSTDEFTKSPKRRKRR